MQVKVEFAIKGVQRKGLTPRYELNVILKDINANQRTFGKNYSNIELISARPLDMVDYQLICNERCLWDLMQNAKGFRIKDAHA